MHKNECEDLRLSDTLTAWYLQNKRDLPWRRTTDPYAIWLSEVILQQTRVEQGMNYYLRFMETFPTVKSLADADEDEVLKLWQGLGYYSRARNLHHAAKTIATSFDGVFPNKYSDILSLKGVGEYTAAAIASFAYNLPYAVVDGNVYRVLSRIFAIGEAIDTSGGKKLFANLAQKLLNKKHPATHNQSMMEFGAIQCVPSSPNCINCPASDICLAYAQGTIAKYPLKSLKTKVSKRYFNYFDIRYQSSTYLHKRTKKDIWKNLYEFPLIETLEEMLFDELQKQDDFNIFFKENDQLKIELKQQGLKHILSHQIIYANFYQVEVQNDNFLKKLFVKINLDERDRYAISRLTEKYLELL